MGAGLGSSAVLDVQAFVDKFRYNAKRASLVQSRIKAIDRMADIELVEADPEYCFRRADLLAQRIMAAAWSSPCLVMRQHACCTLASACLHAAFVLTWQAQHTVGGAADVPGLQRSVPRAERTGATHTARPVDAQTC